MEAISSQVAALRSHFPTSVAWGLNPARNIQLSWRRGLIFHPRFWLPFRSATRVLQRAFDLNHIVGSLGDWFYLRAAVKQPIVLTVAVRSAPCDQALLQKVSRFIVEWESDVDQVTRAGIPPERVVVIPPPVDLTEFAPSPKPEGPFTVLFASSPPTVEGIADRGVDMLLDVAGRRPDIRFHLVWRPWGDSLGWVRMMIADRGLSNVKVTTGAVQHMAEAYRSAHATIALFRNPAATKSVPNSIIESLASGRPTIATAIVSCSSAISSAGAGVTVEANAAEVLRAIDIVENRWSEMSRSARQLAESRFSSSAFFQAHANLYKSLLT